MEKNILILTHRGLEPSNLDFYPESSLESFKNQLERGFGIEFDCNFAKDGIFIFHDSTLERISSGKDKRKFLDMTLSEIKKVKIQGKNKIGRIGDFLEILRLIEKNNSQINALHFKGKFQKKSNIDLVLNLLNGNKKASKKILIFDLKPKSAAYVKSKYPKLNLAASVSHEYDLQRYSSCVRNTLISISSALENKKIYDWVWLDEWDLIDKANKIKKFYTAENFKKLKDAGYKIGLVTPELHATSPGLYGGESHPDAKNISILFKRIKEIINLKPDAICTDYPKEVKKLI
jgi:glycerophosphoryl diester phosphodiesterase